MINRDGMAYRLAIVGVGAALVVLLIGASTVAALGHGVPKELWVIGGALSGSLVGILIPTPRAGSSREATPRTAGYATHNAAVDAAQKRAREIGRTAAERASAAHAAVAQAQAAQRAAQQAAPAARADAEQVAAERTDAAHEAAERADAAHAAATGAQQALTDVDARRRQLKTPLVGMAAASALREGGQGHEAAALAVNLQHEGLEQAQGELLAQPGAPALEAAVEVHEAAHTAAAKAAPGAAQGEAGWFGAVKAITSEARILIPLLLFAVALALAALLGLGVIRAHSCVPETSSSCSYYATTTHELAKAMVALASAAGGALLGVFATSPGDTSSKAAPAAKGAAG